MYNNLLHLTQQLGWVLLHSLWQGALIAGLLVIVLRFVRSAHVKHLLCIGAMTSLLIACVVTFFWTSTNAPSATITTFTVAGESSASPATHKKNTFTAQSAKGIAPAPESTVAPAVLVEKSQLSFNPAPLLMVGGSIWLAGFLFCITKRLHGVWQLKKWKDASTRELPENLKKAALLAQSKFKDAERVMIRICDHVTTPVIHGLVKPVIYLPMSVANGLSIRELDLILTHEFAHWCRRDTWVQAWQLVLDSIFFYHPAVMWISGTAQRTREEATDDLVLNMGASRQSYAHVLASLAISQMSNIPEASLAATGNHLAHRIRRFMNKPEKTQYHTPSRGESFLLSTVAVTALACGLFTACEKKKAASEPQTFKTDRVPSVNSSDIDDKAASLSKEDRLQNLQKEIAKMSVAELEELLRNLSGLQKDKNFESKIRRAIFMRLAQIDPQRALELVKIEKLSTQEQAFELVFFQWALDDFEAAFKAAKEQETHAMRSNSIRSALNGLAETDPSKAFELARKEKSMSDYSISKIIVKWAAKSPLEAYEKASLLSWHYQNTCQQDIFINLFFNDRANFELLYHSVEDPATLQISVRKILSKISKSKDPNVAQLLESLMPYLSDEQIKSISKPPLPEEAKTNPEAYGKNLLRVSDNWQDINLFLEDYGSRDPIATMAFAEQISSDFARAKAYTKVMKEWVSRDKSAALDYALNNFSVNKMKAAQMGHLIAVNEPQKTLEKILSHPNYGESHSILAGQFLHDWAYDDIESASKYLQEIDSETPYASDFYESVASRYASYTKEGVAWINQIENQENKNAATRSLVGMWAHRSFEEAAEWTNTLPVSEQRDHAIAGLTRQIAWKDPRLALEWKNEISDDAMRLEHIKYSLNELRKKDATAAEAWLESNTTLTQSEREALAR